MNFKISVEIDGEDMGDVDIIVGIDGIKRYTLDYASITCCHKISDSFKKEMYGIVREALEKRGIR